MGRKDIITKEYMEDTEVFADVFNHMIYKGEEKVNVCKAIQGIEERGRAAGRSEGIQIGAEHEQRLTKSLLKDNRIDDLKRALDDPAFRQKLLEAILNIVVYMAELNCFTILIQLNMESVYAYKSTSVCKNTNIRYHFKALCGKYEI